MTKQKEIDALDAFIAQMGEDSYLGPWLARNRDAVVSDIRNDVYLTPDWREQQEQYQRRIDEARKEAEDLRAKATRVLKDQLSVTLNSVSSLLAASAESMRAAAGRTEDAATSLRHRVDGALHMLTQ